VRGGDLQLGFRVNAGSMRVLLIAEAANPEWASVPLVGWSHCAAIAKLTDAHVVTQVRNREAFLRAGWREDVDFTSIDSEAAARPLWRFDRLLRSATGLGWTATTALAALPYYYFEHLVWRRFGARIQSGEFALVHRVTPLSPTTPSTIAARCRAAGVPFLWGPINGGVAWPSEFADRRRAEGEWLSYVRAAYKLLPAYRATRRNAAALLVGSRATWEQLPAADHPRCLYIPENGIDPRRFDRRVEGPARSPLRLAFVGRLVPYKGADMLLEAAAPLLRAGLVEVDVIGDGPEMPRLRALVEAEGLGAGVRLDGWVDNKILQDRLVGSDVFAFPSIREFGGAVVLEAMALGLVPIVVDYGGPGELVTDATGFRVPMGTRSEIVARFRAIIGDLAANPGGIRAMGDRARERALSSFTWDAKARQTVSAYRWVLGRGPKPDLRCPGPDA
jgi:glycosyltransferase involved in cell wall biosynthesis